jgi:hypothetical protein
VRRLSAMAERIERNERYFQGRHGDPAPDSLRLSWREDAAAIRRIIQLLKKGRA